VSVRFESLRASWLRGRPFVVEVCVYVCERGFWEVLWVLEKIVFGGAMLGGQIRRWNVVFC